MGKMRAVYLLALLIVAAAVVQTNSSVNQVRSECPGDCRAKCLGREKFIRNKDCPGNKNCCVVGSRKTGKAKEGRQNENIQGKKVKQIKGKKEKERNGKKKTPKKNVSKKKKKKKKKS